MRRREVAMRALAAALLVALLRAASSNPKHPGDTKTDYYKLLKLKKGFSEKELKTAYRNAAKKYHPDKNPGDEKAAKKFALVAEAVTTSREASASTRSVAVDLAAPVLTSQNLRWRQAPPRRRRIGRQSTRRFCRGFRECRSRGLQFQFSKFGLRSEAARATAAAARHHRGSRRRYRPKSSRLRDLWVGSRRYHAWKGRP